MNTFFLFLVLVSSVSAGEVVMSDHLHHVRTVDGIQPPSCDVVRHRVQEYAKRETEADTVIDWFSSEARTLEERGRLLEFFRRMPFFTADRVAESLLVEHLWRTGPEAEAFVKRAGVGSALQSTKHAWSDPFSGLFPEGVNVDVTSSSVSLQQRMTLEEFCLGRSDLVLVFRKGDDILRFQGENDPELLGESLPN